MNAGTSATESNGRLSGHRRLFIERVELSQCGSRSVYSSIPADACLPALLTEFAARFLPSRERERQRGRNFWDGNNSGSVRSIAYVWANFSTLENVI